MLLRRPRCCGGSREVGLSLSVEAAVERIAALEDHHARQPHHLSQRGHEVDTAGNVRFIGA
jgi:hypothetical protein